VSELDWIGCELYNLGSYWIFLLWIMDVDPFPHIIIGQAVREIDHRSGRQRNMTIADEIRKIALQGRPSPIPKYKITC
jgi:hypothetical protein